jgi:hypothetical protein
MFPGGIADKLGNRYEAKWLVRQLLDVISGKAEWLQFEGITPQFSGFEFAVYKGNLTEWHQTKINAPHGNWTINALKREEVLAAFKKRLEASINNRCIFVSQDPAKDFRDLIERAKISNDLKEFTDNLSTKQKPKFNQLKDGWGVDEETTYSWLRRCEAKMIAESEIEAAVASYSDLYFINGSSSGFSILRDYCEERFNKKLTTEIVKSEIIEADKLVIKDWSLDPTLRENLLSETDAYLQTYNPFGAGGSIIQRSQTQELTDLVNLPEGPLVVLLTGIAGSGKSGVIRGSITNLRDLGVTNLAFRVDHRLDCSTPQELGRALVRREASPVSILKGLEPESLSVLIVDQMDAVSEVSGRNGAVKEAVLRMVTDAQNFKTVRLVFVCRSFDLENDPRLKSLQESIRVMRIEVPQLDWDKEVAPLLVEKEIDKNRLSEAQKDLLRLPLNLSIFLEVGVEGENFASRNDLFDKLIAKKERAIRQGRTVMWTLVRPLTALANWMSDRQKLNAPETVLDDFPGALDILLSEGLLIRVRHQVNFFHDSFFDYLYARIFIENDESLVDLLTSAEQHLFRRTQVRQILEALRQNNNARYVRELEAILTSGEVRYHIKLAVAKWLGSLSDPTKGEQDILLRFDIENEPFHPLVRYAFLSSVGWFDRLCNDGWVQKVLNGERDDRRENVLRWLSNIALERPGEVASLLDTWWGENPERGNRLLHWFLLARLQKPDQRFLELYERVIRSRPPGLFEKRAPRRIGMLLANMTPSPSEECSGILKALLEIWFEANPGQHPFEREEIDNFDMGSLGKFSENSPKAFIAGTIDALNLSIDEINRREAKRRSDYSFRHRIFSGKSYGSDRFLYLFRSALQKIAKEDPDAAQEILSHLDASRHEALLHLHLETISANGEAFAIHLLDLLRKKGLFDAGWERAEWRSFADAARAAFPFLSMDDRCRIEEVIFSHRPEIQLAIEIAHKQHGETDPKSIRSRVIKVLNWSGREQWCVLESIGEDLLTAVGLRYLKKLRRKFPHCKVPEPFHSEGHIVGSPIKREKTIYMNDEQWLRAITRYNNDNSRDFFEGGYRELAGELQQASKKNPARFIALMKRIPQEANQTYIYHVLWGLSEAEEVEDDLLKEAIWDAHARPDRPYGKEIARLFEKRPQIASDPSIFDVLAWYVENGEANEDETNDSQDTEQEIYSINDLIFHGIGEKLHVQGINSARGCAVEAMGKVLWQLPDIAEKVFDIIERRIAVESLVSVRCCLMRPLLPLFTRDKFRSAQLVEHLVQPISESSASSQKSHIPVHS